MELSTGRFISTSRSATSSGDSGIHIGRNSCRDDDGSAGCDCVGAGCNDCASEGNEGRGCVGERGCEGCTGKCDSREGSGCDDCEGCKAEDVTGDRCGYSIADGPDPDDVEVTPKCGKVRVPKSGKVAGGAGACAGASLRRGLLRAMSFNRV